MAGIAQSADRIIQNRSAVDTILTQLAADYNVALKDVIEGPVFPEYTPDPRKMNPWIAISDREARLVSVIEQMAARLAVLEERIATGEQTAKLSTSKVGGKK